MNALMVIESMFGNTRQIGEEIARGLADGGATVEVVDVASAPGAIAPGIDLVLIGAPTHNRSLSTPSSRAQAAQRGAPRVATGAREWIAGASFPNTTIIAVFDTCTSRSWMSGSAAKAAVKMLRGRGLGARAQTFLVGGTQGPLQPGELEQAYTWGRELAAA